MSDKKKSILKVNNPAFVANTDETERLRREIYRPDIEKLKLFTQMLRTNNLLKKAKITHK
jgi:hypothetical protein